MAAALLPIAAVEAVVREGLVWPVGSFVVCSVIALLLPWRRTHPLLAVAGAFGAIAAVDLTSLAVGVEWTGLHTMVCSVVLPYALFRWGSGREAALGLPVVLVPVGALPGFDSANSAGDVVAGVIFVLLAMTLGAALRYRGTAWLRGIDQAKLREREQIARELHDTVAHHVSAIAIQAQAGRAVAATKPESVLDALVVVEKEASRALSEMRTIVSALRAGEQDSIVAGPRPGVAEIASLARNDGTRPSVDVTLTGALDELHPSVDAALYRLAQESVTNALRHARHAAVVHVVVSGEDDQVRLTVWDDGDVRPATAAASSSGFGLLGMAERARLLGGTLAAGPNRESGWTVAATLPRTGAAP